MTSSIASSSKASFQPLATTNSVSGGGGSQQQGGAIRTWSQASLDFSVLRNSLFGGRASPSKPRVAAGPASLPVAVTAHHAPIAPQTSFLLPTKPIFLATNNGDMQGVEENIYHWKVLNLSRAKLKASSRTSALLSGFAMVAMVEIQIDHEGEKQVPEALLITFAICTVLLIAVHMLALMISTCILPNVEAVANLHLQQQKTIFESPHMKMNFVIELAWGFSTVLGILLFLVEIAILCWVKFYTISQTAAWVATGLLIPIMGIFIAFAAHFYLKLVSHKSEVYEDNIKELQLLSDQLEDSKEEDEEKDDDKMTAAASSPVIGASSSAHLPPLTSSSRRTSPARSPSPASASMMQIV